MAATTIERNTVFAGEFPHKGTLPVAANVLILKGTIVCRNSDGRAVVGIDDNNAYPAVGKASSTVDNRTTAPSGGGAGAEYVEIEYGVHGWAFTGTTPVPGQVVFVVDNQTVSIDSDSGTRGIAGYVSEVVGTTCYVLMGPTVAGQIVIAAAEAADLDTAQTDIAALETDATTAYAQVGIPIASFLDADGDPLAKFVSGDNTTFGFNLADSEALNLRWNNHATPGTALNQIALPYDLDDTAAAYLEFLCSKSGATAGDATTLTITAYITAAGDLHDADSNCGGVTNALTGNATAKTTAVLSLTIAAADIPANARSMTFTVTPTAGLLGTDDLMIHSVRLRYKRKQMTS